MGRRFRPHVAGGTFHLTTRLQQREKLFTPGLRTAIVAVLREHVAYADVELLAYVVMPNHLHLVVRQGKAPLSLLMQPFLRRVARLVQRAHRREGHVFERRYRDHACIAPDHLRNAIVYTHLNPVRASLTGEPGDYPWSSYGEWVGDHGAPDGRTPLVALERAAPLFATGPERSMGELRGDYLDFERWRAECDRIQAEHPPGDDGAPALPPPPDVNHGDANWLWSVAPSSATRSRWASRRSEPGGAQAQRPELAAIARAAIAAEAPGLAADLVRSRWGGPSYVRVRHAIIRQAMVAGYRGTAIARFLRISNSAVSAVITAERKRLLQPPS